MKKYIIVLITIFTINIAFYNPVIAAGKSNVSRDVIPAKSALDKAIDDYEELIDDYVAVYHKMKSGDPEVNDEFTALASRAEKIAQAFQDNASEMTSGHTERIQKIAEKMQKVFAEDNNDADLVEDAEDIDYEQSEEEQPILPAKTLDQAISDYEKLIDDYIVIYVSMKSGDADATEKAERLSSEIAEMGQILEANASEMTPEHVERLSKIARKVQEAVAADLE